MCFKNRKSCYGCSFIDANSLESILHGSIIECLVGIFSFEKIKLQLQLQNIWIYFTKIETDIMILSSKIEYAGFGLCTIKLEKMKCLLLAKKKEIEEKAFKMIGKEVNLNSIEEVAFILYDKLKLKPIVDDKKHALVANEKLKYHSTSKEVLLQLSKQHEFPKLMILWRKINHSLANSLFPIEKVNYVTVLAFK